MSISRFTLLLALVFSAGCGESETARLRERYLLSEEPVGSRVVSKIRSALQQQDAPPSMDVVLTGRVYAGKDSEPWSEGKCGFILTDFAGHSGDSEHDPYECPFCSESIEDYRVFVSFGDRGKAAPFDSREVFGLKERQKVMLQGTATLDDAGEVMVDGVGLFVMP